MSGRHPHDTEYETVRLTGSLAADTGAPSRSFAAGAEIGRFVVLEKIGEGGMGIVLCAHDPALDRKVAIKVLHPRAHDDEADGRHRLIREARAMARLSHPNVLPVYEAGVIADQVFIAMELAPSTMRQWLETRRARSEILAVFQAAGRGLEAAHRAGIVHRDFKPENVLLGDDGRPRVADFGLAGLHRTADGERSSPTPGDGSIVTGSIAGTPAYMAPEQYLGGPVDHRADQFAFCVSLYEALYGERPFRGETFEALAESVTSGVIPPAPAGSDVPTWLRDVIERGLAQSPDRRFESMGQLLDALGADPRARRGRRMAFAGIVAGAVVLTGGTVAAISLIRPAQAPLCRADPSRLAGVWDADRKAAVRAAFFASGHPNWEDGFGRVSAALDAYAAGWMAARQDACEATHVRRERSGAALDLRMSCLDRRLAEARSLVDLYDHDLNREGVDRAVEAAGGLTQPATCAPSDAPPPPAIRDRVESLWSWLATVRALIDTGRYAQARMFAVHAVLDARLLGYAPTLAESLFRLGSAYVSSGDLAAAERVLEDAVKVAGEAHDDARAAYSWALLLFVVGDQQGRIADALRLLPAAEAAVARVDDPALTAHYWNVVGNVHRARADYEQARDCFARALVAAKRAAPGNPEIVRASSNLGVASMRLGELDKAHAYLDQALALAEIQLGPEHPTVLGLVSNQALLLDREGNHEQAVPLLERVVAGRAKVLGPDHVQVGLAYTNLGVALLNRLEYDEARAAFERAVAIGDKAGPDLPEQGVALSNLGMVLDELGRPDEALAALERAHAIKSNRLGPDHFTLWVTEKAIAEVQLRRKQYAEAARRAERALALRGTRPGDSGELAEVRFALARALWELPGRRRDAVAAARRALTELDGAAPGWEANRTVVADWLKAHRAAAD